MASISAEQRDSRSLLGHGALFCCQRFRQPGIDQDQVDERQGGRHEGRYCVTPLAEEPARDRADDKSQPKGGADHAQAFGSFLGVRHIGNVGLGDGEVAAGEAVQDAGGEQDDERVGNAEQDEAEKGAKDGDQQDRAAAKAVGETSQDGRADQLRGSIGGNQQACDKAVGFKGLRIIRAKAAGSG